MMAPTRATRTLTLLVLGLAASGAGWANAQDGAPEAGEEAGALEVQERAALSPAEQVAAGERALQQGDELSRRVSGLLAEAREAGDIIRVTCVDDKLTQINASLRTLEQRVQNLRDAVGAEDSSRAGHEYTVVTVLSQKFQVLGREANQCVGEDLYETGTTRVEVIVDDSVTTEDPALINDPPAMDVPAIVPPASGTT